MVEYLREEMVSVLKDHFDKKGFSVYPYWKVFGVRVPIYCIKGGVTKERRKEVIIEVITTQDISKEDFFRTIDIKMLLDRHKPDSVHKIENASPLQFYRHYFPWARVYYAIADYADDTSRQSYNDFKKNCEDNNIGLIKVFNPKDKKIKNKVEIISKKHLSHTLMDEICDKINRIIKPDEDVAKVVRDEIESHLDQVLDYLVNYPAPEYQRRAIIGRDGPQISLFLLNKVQNLKYLEYRKGLHTLSLEYRDQKNNDYKIACEYVELFWDTYLGIAYPNPETQEKFEEIFLGDFTYREHFVHQFQVFLLGSVIIDMLYASDSRNILEEFRRNFKVPFERAWLAASTYHDYNYSTQKYKSWYRKYLTDVMQMSNKKVQDNLSELNLDIAVVRENFLQMAEIIINILCNDENVTEETRNSDQFKEILPLFLYEKLVTERNHALTSGVTLFKIYKKTPKLHEGRIDSNGMSLAAIKQTALAISLHDEGMWEYFCGCKGCYLNLEPPTCENCRKKNIKYTKCNSYDEKFKDIKILESINLKKLPLLYLLILCDSCQDQGRGVLNSRITETFIEGLETNQKGKIGITFIAKDEDSYNDKLDEFNRVKQFLKDGDFTVILRLMDPEKPQKHKNFVF